MDKTSYFDRAKDDEWARREYTKEEHAAIDWFMDVAGISAGQKVLEPGCGTGRCTQKLSVRVGRGGEVVAVDPSAALIRECRRRTEGLHNVRLLQMPVEDIEFPPGFFDHVFCLCVFPHFDDKARVIGLFRSLLLPLGRLTVAHLEGSRILNRMHRERGGPVKADRIPPYAEMARLLGASGFRVDFFRDEDDGYLLVATRQEGR